MKYLFFLLTLIACNTSFAQLWEEPIDTLKYYDKLEKLSGEKLGIQSYSVAMFDGDNNPVQYNHYSFDEKGNLVKECGGISADQELDTMYYFYNENGVFQEATGSAQKRTNAKRDFHFNENGRLIAISSNNKAAKGVRFTYTSDNLLDSIIYSDANRICFHYNAQRKLSKKEIYMGGTMTLLYLYDYPDSSTISYSDCLFKNATETYPCTEKTGYFDKEGRILKLDTKFGGESGLHVMKVEYDQKGNVSKVLFEEPSGNVETNYTRNSKGLLTRVQHEKDGEIYNYAVFTYTYR